VESAVFIIQEKEKEKYLQLVTVLEGESIILQLQASFSTSNFIFGDEWRQIQMMFVVVIHIGNDYRV